jgi:hypothetical protein
MIDSASTDILPLFGIDELQSLCHSLFLLVVDLPNGSDFPKQVGNTECRKSQI